jgi:hypothetical protein
VLTQDQIDHFRTFGFVVLRGALDGRLLGSLIEEVDAARSRAPARARPKAAASLVTTFPPLTSR